MSTKASSSDDLERRSEAFVAAATRVRTEIARKIIGYEETISHMLVCVLSGGHALLEGVPGVGKTLFVKTLADVLGLEFRRLQFTPDLMPTDITGTDFLEQRGESREFRFRKGPVFGNLILADEINRATPKTQSALLEAMQERAVTIGGQAHELPDPFLVFATQNPIEMEGTYPLPEAQLDRFLFKLKIPAPTPNELREILSRTTGTEAEDPAAVLNADEIRDFRGLVREVHVPDPALDYTVRLLDATRPDGEHSPQSVRRYVRHGASPRGGQALLLGGKVSALLQGRLHVSIEDLHSVAVPALAHRILLDFEAEADGVPAESILEEILGEVATARGEVEEWSRAMKDE